MGNKASSTSDSAARVPLPAPGDDSDMDCGGGQAVYERDVEEETASDRGHRSVGGDREREARGTAPNDDEGSPDTNFLKASLGSDPEPSLKPSLKPSRLRDRESKDHVSHSCTPGLCPSSSGCYTPTSPAPLQPTSFQLLLHCDAEKTTTTKTLTISDFPTSTFSLKQAIEDDAHIPLCCQRLQLENIPLEDSERLDTCHLRDGDTVHVYYSSEADVGDVLEVIAAMKLMIPYINSIQSQLSGPLTHSLDADLRECIKSHQVESLAFKYFYPCNAERSKANRLLFVQHGGLEAMHELHLALLQKPWSKLPVQMQYLEHAILRNLWNITAAFSVRSLVLCRPTIVAVSQSLLRVKVHRDKLIEAIPLNASVPFNVGGGRMEMNRIVSEVIYKAAGVLCNLAELPQCRLQLASDKLVVNQFIATMLTPTYKYIASLVTVAGMLCLSYSPETHVHLIRSEVLVGVMHTCKVQRKWYQITAEEIRLDTQLLSYFAVMFLSQLVTASSHLILPAQLRDIAQFMRTFLSSANYQEIREHEVKNGYIWSTLVPFVRVAYFPFSNPNRTFTRHAVTSSDVSEMKELEQMCIEAGVFSLQNTLSGEPGREILSQEGLLEYVTCLPWCLQRGTKACTRAHELVGSLGQKLHLEPPRLQTLARAKLAAWHFGLDKVYSSLSVHELLSEVC